MPRYYVRILLHSLIQYHGEIQEELSSGAKHRKRLVTMLENVCNPPLAGKFNAELIENVLAFSGNKFKEEPMERFEVSITIPSELEWFAHQLKGRGFVTFMGSNASSSYNRLVGYVASEFLSANLAIGGHIDLAQKSKQQLMMLQAALLLSVFNRVKENFNHGKIYITQFGYRLGYNLT